MPLKGMRAIGPVLLLVLCLAGCDVPKFVKTPLTPRTRVSYPSLGVSFELPKQAERRAARYELLPGDEKMTMQMYNIRARLTVAMHPTRGSAFSEPCYWLLLEFDRIDKNEYERFLEGKAKQLNGILGGPDHWKRVASPSGIPEISSYMMPGIQNWQENLVMRRSVALDNGDVVVAGVKLVNNPGAFPDKEEDIKELVKILQSIQPLKAQ